MRVAQRSRRGQICRRSRLGVRYAGWFSSLSEFERYSFVSRSSLELGRWGEWIALKHLRKLGWDIVARNWKGYGGEVDLIAYDGPFLVFVEVKTRRRPVARAPEERVDWEKERRLDELALNFLLRYEICETPVRIDVIAIEATDTQEFVLRHYKG